MTRDETLHALALEIELNWLSEVLIARMAQHFEQTPGVATPELPVPLAGSALANLCGEGNLGANERLVLALALAPHLRPQLLDLLFVPNQNLARGFTEFGGLKGQSHGGFIPTGETAAFLVAGSSIKERIRLMQMFNPDHTFSRNSLLSLASTPKGEPRLSGMLVISDEWLNRLSTGATSKPNFSAEFPAELLTTRLGWDQLVLRDYTIDQLMILSTWLSQTVQLNNEWTPVTRPDVGLRAVLQGPAGVGKTLSAILLGKQSSADVYKLDLAFIASLDRAQAQNGLDRIFSLATSRRWILLLDNADLLQSVDPHWLHSPNLAYLRRHLNAFAGLALFESRLPNAQAMFSGGSTHLNVQFEVPDFGQRLRLWKIYLPKEKTGDDVVLDVVAEKYLLTGAQIANVVLRAILLCMKRGSSHVNASDLVNGLVGVDEL